MSKIVVLFAHGRTGTHMLRSILSQEPWLRNFGEAFNPAIEQWNRHSFFPHLRQNLAGQGAVDVVAAKRLVDGFFDHLEASIEGGHGLLDLKVGQISAMDWPPFIQGTVPVILDRVISRGWPIVLCRRRDQLAAYVSQKRAEQTGVWVRRTDKPTDGSVDAKLEIAPSQLLRFFAQQERAAADVDHWLSAYARKSLIHYEDFAHFPALPDPVREVFSAAFGRTLQRGVKADTVKLVADHRAAIANQDEVREALRRAGYAQFWPDAGGTVQSESGIARGPHADTETEAAPPKRITAAQAKERVDALRGDIALTLKQGVPHVEERYALADLATEVGHFQDHFVHRGKDAPFSEYRLGGVASFARLMFQARRRDYLSDKAKHRWLIDDKHAGLKFAELLGIPVVPYLLCQSVAEVSAAIAQMGYPAVVKPLTDAEAANVFIFFGPDRVVEHKLRVTMDDAAALARMSRSGRPKWLVQRYIGPLDGEGPPITEIKPYIFYGEVGFVHEVTTYPETAICEWSPDGHEIDSGRPFNRMKGRGFTPEVIADAVRMSLALPSPFLRVDFLVWQGKHYFNEVAPQPGSVSELPRLDRTLGDLYLAAEARLLDDLFNGKIFPEVRSLGKGKAASTA